MAITDIIEESSMIETGAPSIKYEGERPLKKPEMLMAGPDWYLKRMQLLMDEYGYDYDEAGEIAYDSDKYYEVIGIDPEGYGDESRNMKQGIPNTKTIKNQPHMLAYITPNEVDKLKALGGQETMTPEGVPAYPEWDNYGVSKSDFEKGDFTKSTDKTVRDLATGKTGVSASELAKRNEAERKEAERKAKEQKERKEKEDAQKVEKKVQLEKKQKQKERFGLEKFKEDWGKEDEENYGFDKDDTNKDGKVSLSEKYDKFKTNQRDKSLQKTIINEMEVLDPYAKTIKEGGMHLGSGVPVDVWSNMTPKEKQYASVVQDYNIDKIKGLPKSKETGHQKYTHGDLTHYSPKYDTTAYRTGAYPIVKEPPFPTLTSALLSPLKPDPVYESALTSLHRLGTAKAGMSNEALGIEGMTDDEFKEFNVSNKNFPPGGGGGDGGAQDPCAGPNPPAYCFVGGKNQTDKEEEVEEEDWYMPLAFRAEGGRVGRAFGGIMGDDGRRAYGLGSIFKKITKPLKKVFKSPLGKMAILGGLGMLTGGAGPGSFMGKLKGNSFLKSMLLKGGEGAWSMGNISPWKAIGLASGLSGLMAKKNYQKYDDWGDNDDGTGLGDLDQYRNYYQSPRAFRSEGGKMALGEGYKSKELNRMAIDMFGKELRLLNRDELEQLRDEYNIKKGTTEVEAKDGGLMDLGGMEKDYREEGGFVPIGGKEKADDVPARLSKNEFVFTADAVRGAGEGDIDKGAEVMYNMMKNLEAGGEVSEESQGLDGAREMFQTSQRLEEVL